MEQWEDVETIPLCLSLAGQALVGTVTFLFVTAQGALGDQNGGISIPRW